MIIYSICMVIINALDRILIFHIPEFNAIGDAFNYFNIVVDKGIDIYRFFIPPFGQAVITLIIIMRIGIFIYDFVMWWLGKVPMISMS